MTRRHRVVTGALAILVASVLVACTGDQDPDDVAATGATTPTIGDGSASGSASGSCAPVEHPALQVSSHLVGDAEPPGDFSSVPPTSGWHTSRVPESGRYDQPLPDAEIVSALENGIVVMAVHPDLLASSEDTVTALSEQFPDRLLVTPYPTPMPTSVALLSWGVLQRCEDVDPATTTSFVLTERVVADDH